MRDRLALSPSDPSGGEGRIEGENGDENEGHGEGECKCKGHGQGIVKEIGV